MNLIDQGLQLSVDRVPTKEMVVDILSEPLVGVEFKYLLAKLLKWNNMWAVIDLCVLTQQCDGVRRNYP